MWLVLFLGSLHMVSEPNFLSHNVAYREEMKKCVDLESNRVLAKFENNGRIPVTIISKT